MQSGCGRGQGALAADPRPRADEVRLKPTRAPQVVPLYGRGCASKDPRKFPVDGVEIPARPSATRPPSVRQVDLLAGAVPSHARRGARALTCALHGASAGSAVSAWRQRVRCRPGHDASFWPTHAVSRWSAPSTIHPDRSFVICSGVGMAAHPEDKRGASNTCWVSVA